MSRRIIVGTVAALLLGLGACSSATPTATPSASPTTTTPTASPTTTTPAAPEPTATPVTRNATYATAEDLYNAAVMAGHEGSTFTPDNPAKANSTTSGNDGFGEDNSAYFLVYGDAATVKSDLDAIYAGDNPDSILAGKNWIIIGTGLDELQRQLGGVHPTWAAKKPRSKAEPKPKPKPKPAAHEVSERKWAKVVKNPDKYKGKRYIIYGEVTQFDSATGDSNFLADTANRDTTSYDIFDGENSWMQGNASKLEDLVEDDVFKATVTVLGSYSYDTQIGGNTTVPHLQVDAIKQVGHND